MRRFAIIRGISALVCALAVNAAIVVSAVSYHLLSSETKTLPELDLTSIDLSFSETPDETALPAVQSPLPPPTTKAETEDKAETEAEAKAKAETEAKAKAETEAKRLAEVTAKAEEEAKARARAEAQAKAKAEAEAKRQAEAAAKAEAEAKARARAEAQAKAKAEAKKKAEAAAKAEAEAKARAMAEAQAKAQAEAKKKAEEKQKKAAQSQARVKVDKPPKPSRPITVPQYPEGARIRKEAGDVQLEFEVLADGTVGNVWIVKSCGYKELEQAAIKDIRQVPFNPASSNGTGVNSISSFTYEFRIKEEGNPLKSLILPFFH